MYSTSSASRRLPRFYTPGLGAIPSPVRTAPRLVQPLVRLPAVTGLRPAPVPVAISRPVPKPLVLPKPVLVVRPAITPPLAGTPWGSSVNMVRTAWGSMVPAPKPPAAPPRITVALKPNVVSGTGANRTVQLDPSQVAAAKAASNQYLAAQAATGTRAFSLGLDAQGIQNLTQWQTGYAPIARAMVPSVPAESGYHWEAVGSSGLFKQVKSKGVLGTIGGVLKVVAPIAAVAIPGLGVLGGAALAAGGSAAGGALEGQRFNLLKTLIAGGVGAGGQALGVGRAIFGGGIPSAPTTAIAGVGPGGTVTTIPSITSGLGVLSSTPLTVLPGASSAIGGTFSFLAPKLPATALLGSGGAASIASQVASIAAKAKTATGALTGVIGKLFTPTQPGDSTFMPALNMTQAGGPTAGGVPFDAGTMAGVDWTPMLLIGLAAVAVIMFSTKRRR